jgi:hypothetical protein
MMCVMSDGIESPTGPNSDGDGSGVLGNLPRTRPQRASPRRAAARRSAGEKAGAAAAPARSVDGDGGSRSAPESAAGARAATATGRARKASGHRETGQQASRGAAAKRSGDGARRQRRSVTRVEAIPAQGYESEDDAATGAVRPPGGAELVLSAAEIVGELAKAGLSTSERLIKDVLSHLPLS